MRLTTFPEPESDLLFDFSAAIWCDKHDATNHVFPGMDFIVKEAHQQLWVEVKNWEGVSIPASRRGGQRRSFLAKLKSNVYFKETLRAKFIGTCAYLALTDAPLREDVTYVALLESPRMDAALMLHATTRLRALVKRDTLWHITNASGNRAALIVNAAVMNVTEWNMRFRDYPVVPL